jgi:hypothetical protein
MVGAASIESHAPHRHAHAIATPKSRILVPPQASLPIRQSLVRSDASRSPVSHDRQTVAQAVSFKRNTRQKAGCPHTHSMITQFL